MNYIDYFIIVFIISYSLWGFFKGLINVVLDILGYVVAFTAAKLLSPYLIVYINESKSYLNIQNMIVKSLEKIDSSIANNVLSVEMPENITTLLNVDPQLVAILKNYPNIQESIEKNILHLAGKSLLNILTDYVIIILCFICIFIAIKLIFSIIISVFKSRKESLPVPAFNRLAGLTLGFITSIIILSLIFQLAEILSLSTSNILSNAIQKSKYGHLFNSLPILNWITILLTKTVGS